MKSLPKPIRWLLIWISTAILTAGFIVALLIGRFFDWLDPMRKS